MRLRMMGLITVLAAVALTASGCSLAQSLMPKPLVKNVTIAAKVAAPGAQVNGKLKKGAPSDLPLWEGATVVRSKATKSTAGDSWLATLSTTDEYSVVVAGLANGFQKNGWSAEQEDVPSTDTSQTVLTVTGSAAAGVVTVTAQKDKTTQIDYVITKVQ